MKKKEVARIPCAEADGEAENSAVQSFASPDKVRKQKRIVEASVEAVDMEGSDPLASSRAASKIETTRQALAQSPDVDTMAQRGLGYKAWIPSPSGRPQFGDPVEAPVPADLSPPPLTAQLQGLIDQRNSEAAKADQLREQLAAAKDPSPERPVRARSAAHFSD